MRFLSITCLLAAALCAQSLTLSFNPPAVSPGGTTTLTIAYTDPSPSANLTALQFQLVLPAGITPPTTGPSASRPNANYIADFNPANLYTEIGGWGTTFSPWTVVAIPSGTIATWVMTVSPTAALGANVLSLNPPTATTGAPLLGISTGGSAVALTATAATLNVTSIYDLNGDGAINAADVQLARNIAQGLVPNGCVPPFSLVGDNKCNVRDVILVLLAVLGIVH